MVREVSKNQTRLSDSLEKPVGCHSQGGGGGGGALQERGGEERRTQFVGTDGQTDRRSSLWCGGEGGVTLGIRKKHFKCHSVCVQTTEAPG